MHTAVVTGQQQQQQQQHVMVAVSSSSSSSNTVVEQRILPELWDDHIYIPLRYRRISQIQCRTYMLLDIRAEIQQTLAVMGTLCKWPFLSTLILYISPKPRSSFIR